VILVDDHQAAKKTDYVTIDFQVYSNDQKEISDLIVRMDQFLTGLKLVKRIFKNQKLTMKKREMKTDQKDKPQDLEIIEKAQKNDTEGTNETEAVEDQLFL